MNPEVATSSCHKLSIVNVYSLETNDNIILCNNYVSRYLCTIYFTCDEFLENIYNGSNLMYSICINRICFHINSIIFVNGCSVVVFQAEVAESVCECFAGSEKRTCVSGTC